MREHRPKTIAFLVLLALILGTCVFHIGAWGLRAAERDSSDAQERLYQELREKLLEITRAKRGGVDAQAEDAPEDLSGSDVAESDATRKAGALTTLEINGVKVNFHWAPAGSFQMGSPSGEEERYLDETQHEVTLTQGFWVAETETTQELWLAVMGNNPSVNTSSNQLPVVNVSWNDCRDFVEKLNNSYRNDLPSGYKYAMPTEAQWEYACRAGSTTPFNFGSALNGDKANCNGNAPYGTSAKGSNKEKITPVKSYQPNDWGLYDMHGNVWEWCADWCDLKYYSSESAMKDPAGPTSGENRSNRGGSWADDAANCRSAYRGGSKPDASGNNCGFRLVLVQDSQSQDAQIDDAQTDNARLPEVDEPDATRKAGALMTLEINGVKVNFHWAPAGSFQMGSPASEQERDDDELLHKVTLSHGFWIAETETTQELWQAVMGDNPSKFNGDNQLPVDNLTWYECLDFVIKLNSSYDVALPNGYKYAMPTEAQWEYACRAGTTTPFNFGAALNGDQANCQGKYSPYGTSTPGEALGKSAPVKSYNPNAWGLYDMHGNVWEWCADWYDARYYARSSSTIDPSGSMVGSDRVLRGGSWNDVAKYCRSARREHNVAENRHEAFGFRLVLVKDDQSPEAQIDDVQFTDEQDDPSVELERPNGAEPESTREAGAVTTLEINGVKVNFHWAPAGTFQMGYPRSEVGFEPGEFKRRAVTLTQGFWIAETETTQELWQAIMGNNPSGFKDSLQLPVDNVSWNDFQAFVEKLNISYAAVLPSGYKYAMPTEAQWEYACRAGTTTPFNFGSRLNGDKANCNGNIPYGTSVKGEAKGKTTPVKSYEPNPWGLYDMHGNVSEWTADWYESKDSTDARIDPAGPNSGSKHPVRGGNWFARASFCRSVARNGIDPDEHSFSIGCRLVLVSTSPSLSSPAEDPATVLDSLKHDDSDDTREAGALTTVEINGVKVNFHWAPAGSFQMGSCEDEQERDEDEILHEVELTQGFWIAETETTQELWQAVMGNNPSFFTESNQLPVENVSWNDCQEFVTKLNSTYLNVLPAGYKYALPTEAQWEYACRAGTWTPFNNFYGLFNFGDSLNGSKANCNGNFPYGESSPGDYKEKTTTVKSYGANYWGLYDMHGNVCEWCADWFGSYRNTSSWKDPSGRTSGSYRIIRGGSWSDAAVCCRSAFRGYLEPETSDNGVGVRLVLIRDSQPQDTQADDVKPQPTYPSGDVPEDKRPAGAIITLDINGVKASFHWAPAGSFQMGCPDDEQGGRYFERQHEVTLTQGFWVAETETTQALWQAVMEDNPSYFKGSNQLPVESVSWIDCQNFVTKLNSDYRSALPRGYQYAMPTEAQWEYACRAGTTTPFSFGATLNGDNANCDGTAPYGACDQGVYRDEPMPVKSYDPNAWGLYDMHGNVSEWTADWVGLNYYSSSGAKLDPTGPVSGSVRVGRGGAWVDDAMICRSAYRSGSAPDEYGRARGFRLVLIQVAQSQEEDATTVQEYPNGDEPEATREAGAIKTLDINGVKVSFHWAPAGSFLMGSPLSEEQRNDDEVQHEVTLTRGFWIAETITTQRLWEAVMENNPSQIDGLIELPVDNISWNDCQEFIEILNNRFSNALPDGYHYAMPTEAQWEYACRAGTTTPFSFGAILNGDQANCNGNDPYGTNANGGYLKKSSPVKCYDPNNWGLYDMHGNTYEWTSDWYGSYDTSVLPAIDPTGAATGSARVVRGGTWNNSAKLCRSACRGGADPDTTGNNCSFRLVLIRNTQAQDSQEDDATAQTEYPNGDEPEATREAGALKSLVINGVRVNFHWAPAGTFQMGSPYGEAGRKSNETQHEVTITQGFWVAEYPTTIAMYRPYAEQTTRDLTGVSIFKPFALSVHFNEEGSWKTPGFTQEDNEPVTCVSWEDAQDYIEWACQNCPDLPEGYEFALPTEAQWEYACRAGTETPYNFGSEISREKANCVTSSAPTVENPFAWANSQPPEKTTPVKSFAPNAWGLYDMHGNVWEWTSDWLRDYPSEAVVDPRVSSGGSYRAIRGGAWFQDADFCRSARRFGAQDGVRDNTIGFRLVIVPSVAH